MKLSYRGVDFDYSPVMPECTSQEAVGMYRGHAYTDPMMRATAILPAAYGLSYRGIVYHRPTVAAVVVGRVESLQKSGSTRVSKTKAESVAQIHHDHLLHRLQKRIRAAEQRGDQTLIKMLEEEQQQLA
ncbi:MAG: DUF4278 domain-containing protein [Cyanobacteriota bacterium]|nr:DUF4278 domain-containing protein [Cyanobacteriota bacterium]